jgi:putative flippase GtrA
VATGAELRQRLWRLWTSHLRELSAFSIVGASAAVVDLSVFQLLYTSVDLGAVTSKILATAVSVTVAFVGHRYWSFSRRARSGLRREYALFFLVNGLTLGLGTLMIAAVRYPLGQDGALALQLTNVASIALGTVCRFVLYRRWVFLAPAGAPAVVAAAPPAGPRGEPAPASRPGQDRLDHPARRAV